MAKLLKADHARRIELPGVGPAARPVDIDQAQTGFSALRTLRIYRFDPPSVIHGHAEEDEVLIVVLKGEIELEIRSDHWPHNDARFDLAFPDSRRSVACAAYLPPHAEYALTPRTTADVAYARASSTGGRSPAIFRSEASHGGRGPLLLLDESSHAEHLRLQLWQTEEPDAAADLISKDRPAAMGETLIHIRSAPADAVTVDAPGLAGVALDSWDTLAVSNGERAELRVAAHASALGLIVSAA